MLIRALSRNKSFAVYAAVATFVATVWTVLPTPINAAHPSGLTDTSGCDLQTFGSAGDGLTEATAWEISNPDQLWEVNDCPGAYFKLTRNLDATDATLSTTSPIGLDGLSYRESLTGVLDGNGYAISFSMGASSNPLGLFNKLDGATVKNLTLRGSLSSTPSTNLYTGTLALTTAGQNTISNVVVESDITAKSQVGGFIGHIENDSVVLIENSEFSGVLEATGGLIQGYVGGFVGRSIGPLTIRNSTSSGDISVSPSVRYAGGFVAIHEVDPIELTDLHRTGSLSGAKSVIGGIFGVISATSIATLSGLVNTGSVSGAATGQGEVGGIGGNFGGIGTLSNSQNFGQVTNLSSDGRTGGLLGWVNSYNLVNGTQLTVAYATNSGNVTGTTMTGGLIGTSGNSFGGDGELVVSASANSGDITGSLFVGGLVGNLTRANSRFSMIDCENSGAIHTTASVAGGALGGVEVMLNSATISGFTNSGQISSAQHNIGGVVGYLASPLSIISSSNTASISSAGGGGAGGAVGQIRPTANNLNAIRGFSNFGSVRGTNGLAGIVGEVLAVGSNSVLQISSAVNKATIQGFGTGGANAQAGGIVGGLRTSTGIATTVEISQSANLATVSAIMQNVGGLVGVLQASVSASILESYNQGQVESSTSMVGGLVGLAAGELSISNSYNVGSLTGTGILGGIVGDGSSLTSVYSSYFAGSLQPVTNTDGLVTGSVDEISNSYTITTSTHVSASTQLELRTRSTFVGWDFDTVWAFGSCDINDSFPVLRWAEQRNFDLSCLQIQAPTASSVAPTASGPVETPSAPSYLGPIIESTPILTSPGQTFVLSGSRLSGITQVFVNGVSLDIVSSSESELAVRLNIGAFTGLFDLVIISPYGRLTVMDAISITNLEVKANSYGDLLGFRWAATFIGNSRSLSTSQADGILSHLSLFSSATTIVCWGYTTSENPNDWAIAHARTRAKAVCDHLAENVSNAKLLVRVRYGMPKFAAMRATMQFWELKSSQ